MLATVPVATPEQLDDAVDTASRAFPAWAATPVQERQALLERMGQLLYQELDQFVELVVKEVGKSRSLA